MAASSTALEQTILLGDTTAKPPKQNFIIREARLSDLRAMAVISKEAYWLNAVNQFIAPRAIDHPEDMVEIQLRGVQKKFVEPTSLSIVACLPAEKGEKEKVVGYGQFLRKGTDAGAKDFPRSKGRINLLGLWILSWCFWAWNLIAIRIWPDRITDPEAEKTFFGYIKEDGEKYWTSHPERDDRWHAASLVVSPAYQGKGIGRLLMGHVIDMAQRERVLMGLVASPHGEFLYRKLGFEMLGTYTHTVGDEKGGGHMIRYPEGWEGKRH
jgi:GNAT superfamily N-acetyltransferase